MSKEEENEESKDSLEKGCIQRFFIGLVISDVKQPTAPQEFHEEFYSTEDLEMVEVTRIIEEHHESYVCGIVDELFVFKDVPNYIKKWMEIHCDFEAEAVIQGPVLAFAIEIMVPSHIIEKTWIKTAIQAGQI